MISQKIGIPLFNTMYVGDSITDVEAFKTIRQAGGLAVSFNGNRFAIREADIAIIAENTILTEVVADAFRVKGKEGPIILAIDWEDEESNCKKLCLQQFPQAADSGTLRPVPFLKSNRAYLEEIIIFSEKMRKQVRGIAVGSLG